jgi:hypothetical protein
VESPLEHVGYFLKAVPHQHSEDVPVEIKVLDSGSFFTSADG